MKISYNQFDDVNKQFQLIDGVYSIEKDKNDKWIWTSSEFGGSVLNVDNVTFSLHSLISNTIFYDGNSVDLQPNCFSVLKLKVKDKTSFSLKLANPFVAEGDGRVLGVKILRIVVDNDIIF